MKGAGAVAEQTEGSLHRKSHTRPSFSMWSPRWTMLDHVDVVFLDLEMPGMNGYKPYAWLRDRLQGVPIIAYTVHVSEMNVVKQRGFDGFLGKPLDNERFPGQLSRILAREPVWERA